MTDCVENFVLSQILCISEQYVHLPSLVVIVIKERVCLLMLLPSCLTVGLSWKRQLTGCHDLHFLRPNAS